MAGTDPLCRFTWHSLGGHLGCTGYFSSMAIRQVRGIQHSPRLSDLSTITCKYGIMDIDVAVIGHAFEFWEARKSSIDFPLYSRDD